MKSFPFSIVEDPLMRQYSRLSPPARNMFTKYMELLTNCNPSNETKNTSYILLGFSPFEDEEKLTSVNPVIFFEIYLVITNHLKMFSLLVILPVLM